MPPKSKQVSNQLSDADIAILQQARAAQASLASVGLSQKELTTPSHTTPEYENFIEITGLPSRGLFYDGEVFGQPLKVMDLLLIQGVDETNAYQRFTEIFGRRLRNIDPNDILIADELFIALWLRANSFPGFDFPNLPFTCVHCGHKASMDESGFNFSQIKFEISNFEKLIEELDGKDHACITLPVCKDNVIIHFRRRKHQSQVENIIKRDYTNYNQEPDEQMVDLLTMASVIDVGITDLRKVVDEIKEMNPIDFIYLIKQINKYALTSTPIVSYQCRACGESTPTRGYPFRPEIFLPVDN
jgi:hypothetical protein